MYADPAGLRDLARWCLSLSDPPVPARTHIHLAAVRPERAIGWRFPVG
ncbi:Imm32 family immunity protein [Kribbella jejuensis]